jgi:DinB superfamily
MMAGSKKRNSKKTIPRPRAAGKNLSPDAALRKSLVELLNGGNAHLAIADAVANFPAHQRGASAPGLAHTAWQLLEHIRIAQWDMLEFSRDPKHVSPDFPNGYWPKTAAPPNDGAWTKSVETIEGDLRAMIRLLTNPRSDLYAPFPWGDGQTLLREALLVADHNAYHVAQLVDLRRALRIWPKS